MKCLLAMTYAAASYLVGLAAFVYAIGFVGNIAVPRSIDRGVAAPIGVAVAVNVLLLAVVARELHEKYQACRAPGAFGRLRRRFYP